MIITLLSSIACAFGAYQPTAIENSGDCRTPCQTCPCLECRPCRFIPFISLSSGMSWSTRTKIHTDPTFWDPSPQGYNDDLHRSEFYSIGIGWEYCSLWSAMVDFSYRPGFFYQKFQTVFPSSTTPGNLGEKTRFFDLSNWALMWDLFVNKNGHRLSWKIGNFCVAPFIGGGLGVCYNKVSSFRSQVPPGVNGNPLAVVSSVMQDKTWLTLGGQFMAGFVFPFCECFGFEIGYRRFCGGTFRTHSYLIIPNEFTPAENTIRWKGRLNANELYFSLNYIL